MTQIDLFATRRGLFDPAGVNEAISRDSGRGTPRIEAMDRLKRWQRQLEDPSRRPELGESKQRQNFLRDIFEGLLGYETAGVADNYHLEFELSGPADSRPADGALGFFGNVEHRRVRGVIEVKGPGTDLDARSNRKDHLSAVDQAFLYASHQDNCWWVIVSNFDEIRLYQHQRGASVYEHFPLRVLAQLGTEFTRFHYLLHRERLLGDGEAKPVSLQLAQEKWRAQAEITKRFYAEYQEARLELFRRLREQNPEEHPLEVLEGTQLLLDRLLFIMFCANRGLLPRDVVKKLQRSADPKENLAYHSGSLWEAVRGLFNAINVGRDAAGIPGYNGGLFAPAKLDNLALANDTEGGERFILKRILDWDQLDFESQIDVDILGHIFENSVSDLEQLRAEIASDPNKVRLAWRNKQGIFYTPEWVTRYIVRHTVGRYLEEHPEIGPSLKVLDPACGSGAFLIQLIPLFQENIDQVAHEEMDKVRAARSEEELTLFSDPSRLEPEAIYAAIQRSIFGLDNSRESVEITKLSFWLKTVVRGRPLPPLEDNIKYGNSLCEDKNLADDAFVWSEELPSLAEEGVDVIIGNPPWIGEADYEACLRKQYSMAEGTFDLAFIFMELALNRLKLGGYVGFIVPDSVLINKETEKVRRLLTENNTLHEVIKLGEGVFPGVFRGSAILIVQKGPPPPDHRLAGLVVTKTDRQEITDVTQTVNLDVLMSERGSTIQLQRILKNPHREFDVFVGEEDEALIKKIEDRPIDWSELVDHGRGIELNKSGHVIRCPNCFKWDSPPAKLKGVYRTKACSHCGAKYQMEKALSQACLISTDGSDPKEHERHFVDGTDVNRYRLAGYRKIDTSKEGINYKDGSLYTSPKIVFRQAGIGITATIDYDLAAYVPQSVYVFRLKDGLKGDLERYGLEYILGVLNSRVMLYWYFKRTGQIEWQSYPRWTLGRVTSLPIRTIDWDDSRQVRLHDRIVEEVETLVRRGAAGQPDEDLEIERLVMELYGLTPEERQRVWETLRSVQELKIIREVLPPVQIGLEARQVA